MRDMAKTLAARANAIAAYQQQAGPGRPAHGGNRHGSNEIRW
jgi:hypothetical protein